MSIETTELQERDTCAAVVITTLETARAAISRLGEAAPTGAVRGLDIALAGLDFSGTAMAQVADDLKFRASNLHHGDSYRRQCAHALTLAAALLDIFLESQREPKAADFRSGAG
jgi:hypothetical protein